MGGRWLARPFLLGLLTLVLAEVLWLLALPLTGSYSRFVLEPESGSALALTAVAAATIAAAMLLPDPAGFGIESPPSLRIALGFAHVACSRDELAELPHGHFVNAHEEARGSFS